MIGGAAPPLMAAIVMTGEHVASPDAKDYATAAAYTPDILTTDLVNVGRPSLASWTRDKVPFFETTTLNDGAGTPSDSSKGTYMPATFGSGGKLPFTYTFYLETALNTEGYDITEIRTYAGWNENGSALGNQRYELLARPLGGTNFQSLGTFTYAPFDGADTNRASATKLVLTDSDGGSITAGVDAVRFVFQDPGFANINAAIDGTVYYEVDVLGAPHVTRPTIPVSSYVYDGTGSGAQPSTNPAWPDSGGTELINGLLPASTAYTDAQWVGFLDDAPDDGTSHPRVTFDLGATYALNTARIVYLHSTTQAGGSITAPEDVMVSISDDGTAFSTPQSFAAAFDHGDGDAIRVAALDLTGFEGAFVRLDFRNESQWTFLAEVTFAGEETGTNPPPVIMEDTFAGTVIDAGIWIEHDSAEQVAQSNGLSMTTGTGSWTDCGLESVQPFYRDGELTIETVARISTSGAHATPIGYGDWSVGTTAYFATFQSGGTFYTWKGFSGVNTAIPYIPNRWYRFVMRLNRLGVLYRIYADTNGDADFDDPGEDVDLLASAPGRYLADTSLNGKKVRFNNHSAGRLELSRVTVCERLSHAALHTAIDEARALYDRAVEGDQPGQYPPGSRAVLLAAIDEAQTVDGDADASREALVTALEALLAQVAAFRASVVGGLHPLNHILGTGQSLSVGWNGSPPLTITQPYLNLMLSGVGQTGTELVPLVEGPNLHNAQVETISSALANTLTARSPGTNYESIVTRHGEGGLAYASLKKGTSWYAKGMDQVGKAQAAAAAMNRDYRVVAVTTVHGESDHVAGNGPVYEGYLRQWQADYDHDVKAMTGQTNDIPLFFCQMSSHTKYNAATSLIPAAQLSAAENSPKLFLVCPKYFMTYSDGVHLTAQSYRHLGEFYGKVLEQVLVEGRDWQPLLPEKIARNGTNIVVDFHVPSPPLAVDTNAVLAQTNLGFEYTDDAASATIVRVSIVDADTIVVALDREPTGTHPRLRYAYTGTPGSWAGWNQPGSARGNIRDSDATPSLYGNTLCNWLVHFDHPIPYDPAHDDGDGDGVPDRWENLRFGGTNVSHGASSNADGDPMNDYEEWAAGTDPLDATDYFRVRGAVAASGHALEISWDTLRDRDYALLGTTTFPNETTWSSLVTTAGHDGSMTYTNGWIGESRRFFRVQLTVREDK